MAIAVQPHHVNAFWPFSTNADAATSTLIPSSGTPVLAASAKIDPGANVDVNIITTGDDMALVAYGGPSGTAAAVANAPASDSISVYIVRTGDTLSDISRMFGVSVNTIIWANNLKGVKDIRVGDTLVILPISGVKRTIIKGDTLKSIAAKYDADAKEIAQFNGLDPAGPLEVGSTIIIPGGEVAPVVKKTQKPSTRSVGSNAPASSGYYSNPLPGFRVTQGLHGHNGVDFGAPRGTPIRASAGGTVIIARNSGWNGGYGNYVVISHKNGTQTLYAHMTNAIVTTGQTVSSGQVIGYVGNTGKSTGNHLHFEIRGAKNPFTR